MDTSCRTCSRTDEFQGISVNAISECNQEPIYLMLIYCTQLQFSNNDTLPQQICPDCLLLLDASYTFWKQCRQTDANLRWGLTACGSAQGMIDPIATASQPQVFRCCFQKCPKVASSHAELEQHAEQQHWQKRRGFQRRQTSEHKYICTVCCAGFSTQQNWEFHQMLLLGTREKTAACNRCQRVFQSSRELVLHRAKNCNAFAAEVQREESESDEWPEQEQETIETEEPKVMQQARDESMSELDQIQLQKWEEEAPDLRQMLGCGSCGYTSRRLYNMRRHQKVKGHQGIRRSGTFRIRNLDESEILDDRDRLEEGEAAPTEESIQFVGIPVKVEPVELLHESEEDEDAPVGKKKHQCTHCGKIMHSRFNKNRHLESSCPALHNKTFRFMCKHCKQFRTNTIRGIRKHMENNCWALKGGRLKRTNKPCALCNKAFNTEKGLERHMRYCTMGEMRSYPCENCDRVFHSHFNLRRHINSGVCINALNCSNCKTLFRHTTGLQRHLRVGCQHDIKKNASKNQCPHCHCMLSRPSNLNRHLKTCYVLKQAGEQKQPTEEEETTTTMVESNEQQADSETIIDT